MKVHHISEQKQNNSKLRQCFVLWTFIFLTDRCYDYIWRLQTHAFHLHHGEDSRQIRFVTDSWYHWLQTTTQWFGFRNNRDTQEVLNQVENHIVGCKEKSKISLTKVEVVSFDISKALDCRKFRRGLHVCTVIEIWGWIWIFANFRLG
jgi:hypothetical protein